MKILVTGAKGQLGTELRLLLEERCPGITDYTDVDSLDLTDANAVMRAVSDGGYSHIVNCAAYTAVDRAEDDPAACTAVNVDAVRNLGHAAASVDARVVHISTDFVFDGRTGVPYTESDKPNPLSHYGDTKRKSETVLLGLVPDAVILRTGWLYSPFGHNFVRTILAKARAGEQLSVVCDQTGTPTSAADLAAMIVHVLLAPSWIPGLYHYAGEGVASWYDFAVAATEIAGIDADIRPCRTVDYQTAATRPHFSVLDKSKVKATFGVTIPHWRASLCRCIARLNTDSL